MEVSDLINLANNSPAVAYHKFVLLSHGRESDLFCFFEGKDSHYYSFRINQATKRKYHPIICGNKKAVLETYRRLEENPSFSKYLKAYFIDRDFDLAIEKHDIYETPTYSIENFYTNEYCLREILKNEFFLTEEDSEFNKVIEIFRKEQAMFHDASLLFNSWYAALKLKGRTKESKINASLSDSFPKGFICIKVGAISADYDLSKIKATFPDALEITEDEINEMIIKLKGEGCSKVFRGKFELQWFYEFLQFLINDANKSKHIIKKKTKFKVDKSIIMSQICQYAITPECLVKYLTKFS